MTFGTFAQFLEKLDVISSRLEITAILADLYQQFSREERQFGSYLLKGSLVPEYESLEFQLSTKMIVRALAKMRKIGGDSIAAGETQTNLFGDDDGSTDQKWVEQQFRNIGDLGLVAEQIVGSANTDESITTVETVFLTLSAIARESGQGSQEQKLQQLVDLLSILDGKSAKYVVRIILNKLRLGFSTMTILDALSWAVHGTKIDHEVLENAYQKKADIGRLAQVYLEAKTAEQRQLALDHYTVTAGVPVVPQLCQRLPSPEEVIKKLKEVYVEPKYDGLRAQIHVFPNPDNPTGKPQVRVFTRSLEDVTEMFPEAVVVAQQIRAKSAVLDGEAIGYDPKTGELVSFQRTITRKRKHDIEATSEETPIKFFVYDLLSVDEKSMIDVPLRERKAILRTLFDDSKQLVQPEFIITSDPVELQLFHERQLELGLEGVVIKQVDSPYQSGRKGWYWVKLKELAGTQGKLSDTLDCVVLGYYPGQGKRTDFGVGAFLVGVRDGEEIKTIAKIGTGLTDDQFRELKQRCDALAVDRQPTEYVVPKGLIPSVWTSPGLVVEIAADEITRSPMHTAGVALRFPRLVKFRDDKTVEQITTKAELEGIAG
ncbi:ATP-dependent DNA ligase [Candidatus Woesebacteria bacterium]|nr:ATP-dependent DNA ligase [Candidatus Woesebacteria bacterium]